MGTWLEKLIEAAAKLDADKLAMLCVTAVGITITVCRQRDGTEQPTEQADQHPAP